MSNILYMRHYNAGNVTDSQMKFLEGPGVVFEYINQACLARRPATGVRPPGLLQGTAENMHAFWLTRTRYR